MSLILLPAFILLLVGMTVAAQEKEAPKPDAELSLEDTPTLLLPKEKRNEAEEDRILASAHFTHGRMLFRREKFAKAIRQYQRAWRYDPQAVTVLDDILDLAGGLKRKNEYGRYYVIQAEVNPKNSLQLRRAAMHLTEQQDFRRALPLFEKSLDLPDDKKSDGSKILIRVEMGRLYLLTNQFDKAAKTFDVVREALDDPKKFGLNDELKKAVLGKAEQTYALFGESFLEAKRLDDAEKMFRQAEAATSNKGLLAWRLARIADRRDDTAETMKQLEAYFETGSSSGGTDAYELYAKCLSKTLGDDKKAQAEILQRTMKLYQQEPKNAALGYYRAQKLRDADKLPEAEKLYQSLLADKATIDAYVGLVNVYRRQENIEKLLDTLGQAAVKIGTLEPLADEAKQVAENPELVTKLLDEASKRKEKNPESLGEGVALAMGMIAIDAKRFEFADEYFGLALEAPTPPKQQLLLAWGLDLFVAEQYEAAARVFQRAIDDNVAPKNNPEFYFYLAGALEMAGKTDDALTAAKKAAEKSPKVTRLQSRVPWIMYHAKRYKDAEEGYQELLKRFDSDYATAGVRESMRDTRLVLSNLCVLQERMPEAEDWLEQVLDEFPEDIGALNDLGYLWADQSKHLNRALEMVGKAVAKEPENIAYLDSLGWAYYRLGRYDDAVKKLEEAVSHDDDPDGVILDHLGDAYLKNKNRDKALETWNRAITSFKKQDDLKLLEKTEAKVKKHSAE